MRRPWGWQTPKCSVLGCSLSFKTERARSLSMTMTPLRFEAKCTQIPWRLILAQARLQVRHEWFEEQWQ
jgi:hypothetical protein